MSFDFTTVYDRTGKDAIALDGMGIVPEAPLPPDAGFSPIPMWIADMSFATVPSVTAALQKRLEHPLFGYFDMPQAYFDAIISWQRDRNGVEGLEAQHIGYEHGVLGGLVSAVAACTEPGATVLVHSPTYVGFTKSMTAAGFSLELSPLVKDAAGVYRLDFEDMDRRLTKTGANVAIFCSPHNPTGRVWEREEIAAAMEVYAKHDCVVISDEIWSDVIHPGHVHVPTQSVSADARMRTVGLYAPSKSFNIAGIVGAYHIIYNDDLRRRVLAQSGSSHYNGANVLSLHALLGAYTDEGKAWLAELNEVLANNVYRARAFFAEHAPEIEIVKPEATYMIWLDATAWCQKHGKTIDDLLQAGWRVGVGWQDGRRFHGPCHIRMNLALPASLLDEALIRLQEHVL
ncbi:aminotransferase class I/II-fold pyridoxal phosphate-dependent enzyme [Collinsella sp. zg1085]|uniref:MalY/PatB family protein n=1 Tax=Collinsella sp. zg1085 TaxID=2844380 RepID=UPI001C0D1D2C|nr:aminotransferase class I/II-fold pyridoxal phosphate-dependent enzyme [Collinsella sp. zg1085]QWT17961.1 aminotransferase class I/II-fold pyridoxal phosphate-dependent enzyme [Collinsella sp. zg1085]